MLYIRTSASCRRQENIKPDTGPLITCPCFITIGYDECEPSICYLEGTLSLRCKYNSKSLLD